MVLFSRLALAGVILSGIEYSGLWVRLISHPWWSLSSTLHGIAGGTVPVLITLWGQRKYGWHRRWILGLWLLLFLVVSGAAYWGKYQFGASYAEDVFAGRVWFFGFKAMTLTLFAALVLVWPSRPC